jgi:arylsulfatase A-like enzyme
MKALPLLFLLLASLGLAKPNILVIVSDDHGYGDISANGGKDIPTPHIDSIAKNGVRFTSGYVSCSFCSPTRAALLTGRYQQRFGHEFNPGATLVAGKDIGLPLSETLLPQRLKTAGYKTGLVGKWHLGFERERLPMSRGFDEFFGFPGGSHSYIDSNAVAGNPIMRGWEKVDEPAYLTDAFAREASAFIDRHAKAPWFLYLAFNAVHGPMHGAQRYAERFPQLSGGRKTYATMLTAMDDAIGAVLARLRANGIEENTLVFFFADNGGPEGVNSSDNGPLRGVKGNAWEGGIRVPFVLQWKGTVPAGQTYDHPVIQVDVFPTALAAAGIAASPEWKLEGTNLLPYLRGEKKDAPHDALYWRFGEQMAIRRGDWKLVKSFAGGGVDQTADARRSVARDATGAQLYNLRADIGETTNLAAQEPAKVKELAAAWAEWNRQNVAPRWFPNDAHPNREGGKQARKNKK